MTTDPYTIDDYAFAQAEFHTHRRTLADYAARLSEAGALLREHTDRVTVTGLAARQPDETTAIDGRALPGAADIQRMLVCYRGAYERLRATWVGLPPAARAGLCAPPSELPSLQPAAE